MYPWYQHFEGSDFDLTDDDKLGVQTIYGNFILFFFLVLSRVEMVIFAFRFNLLRSIEDCMF